MHSRGPQLLHLLIIGVGGGGPAVVDCHSCVRVSDQWSMDKDRVEGAATNIKGKVKEGVGKMTGVAKTEAEGQADQVQGKAQNAVGGAKDKAREVLCGQCLAQWNWRFRIRQRRRWIFEFSCRPLDSGCQEFARPSIHSRDRSTSGWAVKSPSPEDVPKLWRAPSSLMARLTRFANSASCSFDGC